MNKISIITVNRNNSLGLEKTILSVIEQNYASFEFIIIDGASTDDSVDVIHKYANNITYWVSEKDTGIFNAMNKGIQIATGDYCYFLNSADRFVSSTVLSDIFTDCHHTSSFINGNQMNDFGSYQQRVSCLNRPLTLFDFYWGTIKHQATFIRRDLFEKYGSYDEKLTIIADWKFFLQTIGLNNEQVSFTNTDIVYFEWNGMSTNPAHEELHQAERRKVLDECIPKSVQIDYEHFHEVSNYAFVIESMRAKKWLDTLIRGLIKFEKKSRT